MADDLMKRLERILDADTIDLRRLAEIGGGDPKTFYIGTRLDGVDIRGQDLQGMRLPGLDLSKVKKDEKTRVDLIENESQHVKLLAYIAGASSPVALLLDDESGVQVFQGDEQDAFLEAAHTFDGPVVVLAPREDLRSAFEVAERMIWLAQDYVVLAVDDGVKAGNGRLQTHEIGLLRHVIHVRGTIFRQSFRNYDLQALLMLLVLRWRAILRFASQPITFFVQADGYRANMIFDEAVDLFDRAGALGLTTQGCMLFTGPGIRNAYNHLGSEQDWLALLEPADILSTESDTAPLAALLREEEVETEYYDYAGQLAQYLGAAGWSGVRLQVDKAGASLELPLATCHVSVAVERLPSRGNGLRLRKRSLQGISFTDAERVVLVPNVSLGGVADAVVNRRLLPVSSRDVLKLGPKTESLWSVIGVQLRRIREESYLTSQSPYLRLLLASAFCRGEVSIAKAEVLMALVQGEKEMADARLQILSYRRAGNDVLAQFELLAGDREQTRILIEEGYIHIDRYGVRVSGVERERRRSFGLERGGFRDLA